MTTLISARAKRVPEVWERLTAQERRIICELGGLVPGAALVPIRNFSDSQLCLVVLGMRLAATLGDECKFALVYARERPDQVHG